MTDTNPTAESLALAIAFGLTACGLGEGLSGGLGVPSINLAVMAVVASLFASAGSSFCARLGGKVTTPFRGSMPSALPRCPGSCHEAVSPCGNRTMSLKALLFF